MSYDTPLMSGHYHHIYNRGNNGENLFIEERNYAYFFQLYTRYIFPVAETFAYCLMKNHFHLLVRMRQNPDLPGFRNLEGLNAEPNYSQSFSNFFNAYTKSFNKTYHRTGSLFQKNFKRILIHSDSFLIHLVSYIHRNPQKHGFSDDFKSYPFSSYLTIRQEKQSRIEVAQVLEWFGGLSNFEHYHQQFDETKIAHLMVDDV